MFAPACWIVLAIVGQGPANPATSADAVIFRDGRVVVGQVVESDRKGPLLVLVRRRWAQEYLPERFAAWRKAEGPAAQRAEAQRRERLTAWRRDRPAEPADNDRITAWLDRELARKVEAEPPLMLVRLSRAEVKTMERRPKSSARMLRLGWLSGFKDVEAMPLETLSRALEGRGYAPGVDGAVSVESLLPAQPEADARWLARRAATELANDPGGRFLRFGSSLMPEPAPGEAPPVGTAIDLAASAIKDLLGESPDDPLAAKLRDLAARGRVGAMVTRMDLAADFSSVAVNATVWVRVGRERWVPALARSATASPDALPAGAGGPLADDPQVKAAFGAIEGLGFGAIPPEFKRRSLNMGAAARIALAEARAALAKELEPLTLSLELPRSPAPAEKAR